MSERIARYITARCPYCDGALVEAQDTLDHAWSEHGWMAYAPRVHGPLRVQFRCEQGHTGVLQGIFADGALRWRLANEPPQ